MHQVNQQIWKLKCLYQSLCELEARIPKSHVLHQLVGGQKLGALRSLRVVRFMRAIRVVRAGKIVTTGKKMVDKSKKKVQPT